MLDQAASARDYGSLTITSNIILLVLTSTSVAVRLLAKLTTKAKYGLDDVFIVAAQVLWYAEAGLQIKSSDVGRNLVSVMDPGFSTYLKFIWIEGILYAPTVLCISVSVLLFYRRIFPIQEFKRPVEILIGVHIAWALTVLFGQVFICTPVNLIYADAPTMVSSIDKCINYPLFFIITMSVELALNAAVLVMPIRQSLKLQMSVQTRLMLATVFLLGGVSLISGVIRIKQTYRHGEPFVDLAGDVFWLSIHVATALIAASLPVYRPLMRFLATFASTSIRKVYGSGSDGSKDSTKKSYESSVPNHTKGYSEVGSVVGNEKDAHELGEFRQADVEKGQHAGVLGAR